MQFVYDIRSDGGAEGTAQLTVNGAPIGTLPPASSVPAAVENEWVHRSIAIDPALVHVGTNGLEIELSGIVQLDRLHVELAYDHPPRRRAVRR